MFDSQSPGVVSLRRICDGPVSKVKLWKGRQELIDNELPPMVPPKGLPSERQWYLYDRDECKKLTCPIPDTPRLSSRQSTPGRDEDEDAPELGMEIEVSQSQNPSSEQPEKKRQCGICQQYGHNRRTIMVKTTTRLKIGVELVRVTLTKHKLSIPVQQEYNINHALIRGFIN